MWEDLAYLGARCMPLSDLRPPYVGRYSQFRTGHRQTVKLLTRELRELDAKNVVLEVDLRESQIRTDGFPRSDARPASSAIVMSANTKHGPLRYSTAEYDDWWDNLRAIALSLEALRSVDRYGVSKRGEQYRGWAALPPSSDPADNIVTVEQARAFLDEHGGTFEEAAKLLHPDKPDGDATLFRAAVKARDVLAGTSS